MPEGECHALRGAVRPEPKYHATVPKKAHAIIPENCGREWENGGQSQKWQKQRRDERTERDRMIQTSEKKNRTVETDTYLT